MLLLEGDAVAQIEYAPAEASGYPIWGEDIWVMNCIWVLRKAGGRGLGHLLMERMFKVIGDASGVATIALEGHHSPWLKLMHMKYLGFESLGCRGMRYRLKQRELCFKVHLMWMPFKTEANPPEMDWIAMLKGVDFCLAHPSIGLGAWVWMFSMNHVDGAR